MTSRNSDKKSEDIIPDTIFDPKCQKTYIKGKFLGKGGFARCFELTDTLSTKVMAGKIVSKSLLTKAHQKEKMMQEISIQKSLNHKHVVSIFGFFEDTSNVYVLLELCRRRSLMELHKRRKTVTEPEARYFVLQITEGCNYLHSNNIIHRDLKLGNLFLNDNMEVKIGDFGLATRVHGGERKKTLCGTPNYIAPEILSKKGHSFEVDVWSLGCILFTMLVGKPPFETSQLKDTYDRIRRNEYYFPQGNVSPSAKNLIRRLLQGMPEARPTMAQVLEDDFFKSGFLPHGLPSSCLSTAPRMDMFIESTRRPLMPVNDLGNNQQQLVDQNSEGIKQMQLNTIPESKIEDVSDQCLNELHAQLTKVVESEKFGNAAYNEDEAEDPAAVPIFWVSKWVDYTDKYGLGYQLCDNSLGVLFNDSTRILLTSSGDNMQYIEKNGSESLHSLHQYPENLNKKVTLLKYFRNYMNEHLLKAGANISPRDGEEMTRLPFLKSWFRTRSSIILYLSNGTLQINFFDDHSKVILCPLMSAVTYIDSKKSFRTFRLPLIEKYSCSSELATRLSFALQIVKKLLDQRNRN